MTLIVRIHDNQQFLRARSTDYADLDTSNLPSKNMQSYYFNQEKVDQSNEVTLQDATGIAQDQHLYKVKQAIQQEYGFVYPKI